MKRLVCAFICVIYVLSLCGCGMIYIDDSKEQKAYKTAINSLTEALDNKDADAIYNLFSPAVREQDKDLKEQINKLLSVYQGPVDAVGWDGLLAGGASYENGEKSKNSYSEFPVCCGDTYYWFYLDLMYENTFDEDEIGITQLDFCTADEYCYSFYDEDAQISDAVGLNVYADIKLDEEIRCISGKPHKYSQNTKPLDISSVKAFLKASQSLKEFENRFGEPNAENIYIYYELPKTEGKVQYLQICEAEDEILSVCIVDDFKFIEVIFDSED